MSGEDTGSEEAMVSEVLARHWVMSLIRVLVPFLVPFLVPWKKGVVAVVVLAGNERNVRIG